MPQERLVKSHPHVFRSLMTVHGYAPLLGAHAPVGFDFSPTNLNPKKEILASGTFAFPLPGKQFSSSNRAHCPLHCLPYLMRHKFTLNSAKQCKLYSLEPPINGGSSFSTINGMLKAPFGSVLFFVFLWEVVALLSALTCFALTSGVCGCSEILVNFLHEDSAWALQGGCSRRLDETLCGQL